MRIQIHNIYKQLADGIIAGILLTIGGTVYLSCYGASNQIGTYIGAFFFSVALICICAKDYSLYTGKIGYIINRHTKQDFSALLLGLLGNTIIAIGLGYLFGWALPNVKDTANIICGAKLEQGYLQALVRAIMCGLLVYIAVDIYRENKSMIGIIFCVPTFILCGFEHSIADIFYFSASGIVSWQALLYLFIIIIGNSIGSIIIPLLKLVPKNKQD